MSNEQQSNTQIVKTESFSAIETHRNAETAALAMSAKVRAEIEAACIMAERHPRDWEGIRVKMLNECKRPGFCDSARYALPRGNNTITGFSIRFAEAALRYMNNMSAGSDIVYEDDEKQLVKVTVRDYEGNTSVDASVIVPKRIEKKHLKRGEKPVSSRVNSSGETVFLVPATDDEIAMKHNSLVSKAMRTAVLRMLPGDISDECEEMIAQTKRNRDATDPKAATRKVIDSFAELQVMPDQLAAYVGHDLSMLSPKELDELRGLRLAVRDGMISWAEALEAKIGTADDTDEKATARNAAVDEALAKAQAQLDAKRGPKQRASTAQSAQSATPSPRTREPGEDDE